MVVHPEEPVLGESVQDKPKEGPVQEVVMQAREAPSTQEASMMQVWEAPIT
jgi:hypothetical protein